MLRNELSASEIKMFEGLPLNHLLDQNLDIIPFYRLVMEVVFRKNLHGPYVEALRQCINNINECRIYRHTVEYDNMIESILNG